MLQIILGGRLIGLGSKKRRIIGVAALGILFPELPDARERAPCILELGLSLLSRAFGALHRRLVAHRVEPEKNVSLPDAPAFGKRRLDDLAGNAGRNAHDGRRHDPRGIPAHQEELPQRSGQETLNRRTPAKRPGAKSEKKACGVIMISK